MRSSRRLLIALVLCICSVSACATEEIVYYPEPEVSDAASADVTQGDDDSSGVQAGSGVVGELCESHEDCASAFCLNQASLEEIATPYALDMSHYELAGGTCSQSGCLENSDCGDDGLCVAMDARFGADIRLCFSACTELADCLWEADFSCDVADPSQSETACIPDTFLVAPKPTASPITGPACDEHEDCGTEYCLDDEEAAAYGLDTSLLSIPNGMCSNLFCTDDEPCGPGAICFDGEAAFGVAVGICFQLCEELADCRWEEDYGCFSISALDPEDTRKICLPDNIIIAINCDDGDCAALDQE